MSVNMFEHHQPKDPRHLIVGHREASISLRGFEGSIRFMVRGWAEYADAHVERYEETLANDGVLGPAWLALGHSLIELLCGETGRFDCGSLNRNIRAKMAEAGFTVGEIEP